MTPGHDEGFSGRQTAEIVGITYRQLDYWTRTGLVSATVASASGSGSRRAYGYRDLLELKVVKSLLDAGIRLEVVRDVFGYVREQLDEDITRLNLVIQGSDSVVVQTGEELIDILQRGQGVLNILPLGGVKDDVDARILELVPSSSEVELEVDAAAH